MDTVGWARASHAPLGMEATRIPTGVTYQRSEESPSWRARQTRPPLRGNHRGKKDDTVPAHIYLDGGREWLLDRKHPGEGVSPDS